ncbi:NAD(P)-binding protein [Schizophyllum commune Tattone D]|nr:NAD(P)-binding protein [Schizophyllum commune Loenen D]KAI5831131.1 NAD(P)-binding protein [Schizophyllum commune Tattone D]
MTRIATVFGATGKQGSSVVRALLADGTFKPRAVTRDVNSPAARMLAEQGCEVVQVTVPFVAVSESNQGVNIIDASKEEGVRFLVFSHVGLPPFSKTDTGYVMHLMGKPNMVLPWTWIDRDMGPAVTALMKQYNARSFEIIGKTFVLGVARATAEEVAAELAKGKSLLIRYWDALFIAYAFSTEFEWYPGVELPDRRLGKLGVEVGSIEEFARTTLKACVEV